MTQIAGMEISRGRTRLAAGIALIAGISRLFPFPKYLFLVCLAITPVPLLFLLRAA